MTSIREGFHGGDLDPSLWLAEYLPHWTSPERSRARYEVTPQGVELRIEADQPSWLPEELEMRVSNLQTAAFSGEVGSAVGQHHHREGLSVVTAVEPFVGWVASAGWVEVTASASTDPDCMFAVWLVGLEADGPESSSEICVAEVYGKDIHGSISLVTSGIKAHGDPRVRTDMREDVPVGVDASKASTYRAQWADGQTVLTLNGFVLAEIDQAPTTPLQLMISLFEFPSSSQRTPGDYPKTAVVHSVQGEGLVPVT